MSSRWCGVTSADDREPARLGLAQDAHRAEARDVGDVVAGPGRFGEQDVARDDDVFGDARPTAQTEPRRDDPLVHLRALGERVVFGVLDDREIEGARVLERAAHDRARRDAAPVVGDRDRARVAAGRPSR